MYWLDTIILGLVGFAVVWGAFAGLLWQLSRIATVVLAVYSTIAFNETATALIHQWLMPDAPEWVPYLAAYVAVFLLVCLIMVVVTAVMQRTIQRASLQWLNRLLGAMFGGVQAVLLSGIVLLGLSSFAGPFDMIKESRLAGPLLEGIKQGVELLPEEIRQPLEEPAAEDENL